MLTKAARERCAGQSEARSSMATTKSAADFRGSTQIKNHWPRINTNAREFKDQEREKTE
jgi:hypothetical protein